MGHRALVAYRRPDHRYDLRYSHWGGADLSLAAEITTRSPLADGRVAAELLVDGISRDRILADHLDPCVHEALYLVNPAENYAVAAYRVCWLEWGDGRDAGRGAIVEVTPGRSDHELLVWFRATKTVLGDVVEMGGLSRRAALAYLESRICEERDGMVFTYSEENGGPGDGNGDGPRADHWPEDEQW